MLSTKIVKSYLPRSIVIPSRQLLRHPIVVKRNLTTKAFPIDLDFSSYIIGKGIIVFTLTYCSLNWYFYKRTREDIDDNNKKK
jgi:hypothetical protein